jgi:integrase
MIAVQAQISGVPDSNLAIQSSTPGDPSNLRVDFLKILDYVGLPRIDFHDLRHTAASLKLNNGISALSVFESIAHNRTQGAAVRFTVF